MTSASSHAPRWPIVLLAVVALVILSPLLLALLFTGLALTIGLLGTVIKVGVVVGVIWAIAALFKAIFGGGSHQPRPLPREPVQTTALVRIDHEAEMERERREEMAALDRELAKAQAQQQKKPGPQQP